MKAYLFDMNGTLFDDKLYHIRAWADYSRACGHELTTDEIVRLFGCTVQDYMRAILPHEPTPAELAIAVETKERIYRDLYRSHLAENPGVTAFLEQVRADGIPCALVTGAPKENVDFAVDGLGLRKYFRAFVDDKCYVHGKPAPDCYLEGARRLGADPADCTVFEDAFSGVAAAKAAGMRCVAVAVTLPVSRLEAMNPPPDRIVGSFTELLRR